MVVDGRARDRSVTRAVVVASWVPAVDDTTKGRFVADQVEALRATGDVDPIVVSFDPAVLSGGPIDRRSQASAVRLAADAAIRQDPAVFACQGWTGPAGVPVARLPVASGRRGIGAPAHHSLDRRAALEALASRLEPDGRTVIHAHTGYPDGAAAIALIAPLRAPLVITEHATFVAQQLAQPDQRRAYVEAVGRAARLIAVSRSLGDELVAAIPECASKLVVIPNTVAMDDFRPAAIQSRHRDELLYVGYRTETKGIDVLLQAFAAVRAERPSATLRLIGRSPTAEIETGWHRLAGELGIADAVRFDGPSLRSEVAAAMAEADILVHASRRETFGVAPVEALAAGLPIVAADTGPLREILGGDGRLGTLVPPGDATAMARAIGDLLDARSSFDPLTLRRSVEERFGAASVARRLVDLYDEVRREDPTRATPPRSGPSKIPVGQPDGSTTALTLVVGFDTTKASLLLASLPADLRSRLALVCTADGALDGLPSDLALVRTVDADHEYREALMRLGATGPRGGLVARGLRFARHPRAAIERRRLRARHDVARGRVVAAAIREVLASATTPRRPLDVVCLDGLDYLIVRPAIEAGSVRPVPGALRWLADRVAAVETQSNTVADARQPILPALDSAIGRG